MGPLRINSLGTWRPYCNPLLTNHDANYNLRRTLLTLLRQYRYLTTTNLCLLMWSHCSPVFHFNWHYSVPRPLYNNLLLNYRYRQYSTWQILFTWLWRWLPLRLSKRQSPTTVLFRTTLTQTITQYELFIFLLLRCTSIRGRRELRGTVGCVCKYVMCRVCLFMSGAPVMWIMSVYEKLYVTSNQ